MSQYTIHLHPDAEQGGCWVTVHALPGRLSQGDALEAAIANARTAIEGHIVCLREMGQPVPEESDAGDYPPILTIEVAA